MRPRYLKQTEQDMENLKDQKTGTGRGCDGNKNTGLTHKSDNPLKGICNPVPQKNR